MRTRRNDKDIGERITEGIWAGPRLSNCFTKLCPIFPVDKSFLGMQTINIKIRVENEKTNALNEMLQCALKKYTRNSSISQPNYP